LKVACARGRKSLPTVSKEGASSKVTHAKDKLQTTSSKVAHAKDKLQTTGKRGSSKRSGVSEAEGDKLLASSSVAHAKVNLQSKRNRGSSKRRDESESEGNGFVGKLVGFYLDSPFRQMLKQSFGKKWSDLAMSYDLNKEHGHLMGMVMRMASLGKKKASSPLQDQYEIAWEFSYLGESLILGTHLSAVCTVGCQMEAKRQPTSQKHTGMKGHPRNTGKIDVLHRAMSHLVSNLSDDDCLGLAPGSGNDLSNVKAEVELALSLDEDDVEEDIDVMEWITFEDSHHNNNCYDDESILMYSPQLSTGSIDIHRV
jgi:hypothetical protein